jgi:cytochrome c nitrite reductase small subunit
MHVSGKLAAALIGAPLGVVLGLGLYTFGYARGYSYLLDDPEACVNCHVMREQFASWIRSSHRRAAVCNDCHTPHALAPKYLTKALNGFHHSAAFTTGRFPDQIRIKARNRRLAEQACLRCHAEITDAIRAPHPPGDDSVSCIACHPHVGHAQ